MDTELSFLAQLQAEPADDATRLVYADWLEERGDAGCPAKAEFLRVTVDAAAHPGKAGKKMRKRLQELAAGLDTDWLAVVSRLAIENCQGKRAKAESRQGSRLVPLDQVLEFVCDRRWEDLKSTDDRTVRFCDGCKQDVHYCETITEAREHAWAGHCIAVDLGVIRRHGDLEPERMYLGRPSAETLRREEERMRPDSVSAERQRRKKAEEGEVLP